MFRRRPKPKHIPQIVLTPLMQRRLNALVRQRVRFMRRLSQNIPEVRDPEDREVGDEGAAEPAQQSGPADIADLRRLYGNPGRDPVGVLVAFLSGFERVSDPLRELISFYRQAEQARVQHDMVAGWMREGLEVGGEAEDSRA